MSVVSTKVKGSCLRWLTKNSTKHRNMCATLSLHAPRCTEDNLPTPHQAQPTNTHAARNQAGITHALSKLLLPTPRSFDVHARRRPRSSSTVHAGNGRARDWKDTRTALTKASALGPAIQHTISKCQSLWPPPITHLWPHRHCGGYALCAGWMNNQSETRRSRRFCICSSSCVRRVRCV